MPQLETELQTALATARHALEQFNAEPMVPSKRGGPRVSPWFRVWVQASEVAQRWHRQPRVDVSADIQFLTVEEISALVAASAENGELAATDRALYLAAAMTGMRQGELLALRWMDVDWTAGRIRVRQNYVRGEFGTPKSKRSSRSVPLGDVLAGELERHFQMRTTHRAKGKPSTSTRPSLGSNLGSNLSKPHMTSRDLNPP